MGQRIPVTLGNIAPLAVKPFRPGKLALVCEGGGQRGFLLPGCWTNLCAPDLTFDLMLGTSAGAQNLSAYMCNQQGYARKVITRYTTSRQFLIRCALCAAATLSISTGWLRPLRSKCRLP
ncbi:patatin-like phospholipase family protein [Klebsiella pneumoniae]|uniref:Patatin-like phospholipase family protein n=1 Tax=Klebsiella pneumoniae TaxID=573 RepID=A0A939SU93_KLEPN|nr:patatin-like phospholipase family protein [Klebsiella pneumoniae]